MLADLKLKSRLFLSYLVYLVFLSVPGAIAPTYFYLNYEKFAYSTTEFDQKLLANQLAESKTKLQESILGYVSTKDQFFLESYNLNLQKLNQAIAVWHRPENVPGTELADLPEKIRLLTQQLNDLNQYILSLIQAGKTDQAIRAIGADESRQLWLELSANVEQLRMAEIQANSLKIEAVNQAVNQLIFIIALVTIVLFLLAIVLGLMMSDRLLAKANLMLDLMVKYAGAIEQEIKVHQQSSENQTQILTLTSSHLRELHDFCQLANEKSTSISRDFTEISTSLNQISFHIEEIKSLRELSDHLLDHSKKISLNISLKTKHKDSEISQMFLLLNTEIKNINTYAQKLAENLNQIIGKIVGKSENMPRNLFFKPPSWGGNSFEYPTSKDIISHDEGNSEINSDVELIERLLILCEQSKMLAAQLALSSQQQAANSEQILQNNAELEKLEMTTACGLSETKIQVEKLHQLAGHLKSFLG